VGKKPAMGQGKIRIGTSGWSYDHWEGIAYPKSGPVRERLEWFVKRFDTVEVNSSFYHWPKAATFETWRTRVPDGFCMTMKAPRGLTHYSRLANAESWVEKIRDSMEKLGDRRGILLAQLPPDMEVDIPVLDNFLRLFAPWQKTTVEFRHTSWNTEAVFQLLEEYNAAYCVMSGARLPCVLRATADFVYVRLHGPDRQHLYGGSYPDEDLHWWAERLEEWTCQSRDVYVYFNNDGQGNAVYNAERLKSFL